MAVLAADRRAVRHRVPEGRTGSPPDREAGPAGRGSGRPAASVTAYGLTVLLMKRSILTEKLARRGYHVRRKYSVDPLSAAPAP